MKTIFLALVIGLSLPVQAHHSVSSHYDMSRRIEIRGTVVDFKLRSPHSSLVVDGISYEDGVALDDAVQRWEVESSATAGMLRMGINADTFQPGDTITVIGSPNREPGFRFINSANFIKEGVQYGRGGITPYENVSQDALSELSGLERLAGRWSSPGGFAQATTPLALNARGRDAWEAYVPKLSPANTCEPMNFPDMFNAPYLFDLRFEDDTVVMYNQPWEITRRIPLDGRPVRPRPDGLFGVVRSRVEGDALILESGGYIPSRWGLGSATQKIGSGADMPSSQRKTVLERFSVSEDGQTLIYEYTVRDPIYLAAPYSDRLDLHRIADDTPMYDYDCELEAAAMWSRTSADPGLRIGD